MKSLCLAISIALSVVVFPSCAKHMVVSERPSPPAYVKPAPPGPRYVWIDGDWYARGNKYVWREGYWAPARKKQWVPGHWAGRSGRWHWQKGHWR